MSDDPPATSGDPAAREDLVLSEPAQFKALGHPLRHRLLMALRQRPATLAQLATAAGSTKGTVGYHVKVLADAGLVEAAHVQQVRGGTEQYYRPTSGGLRFGAEAPVGGEFLIQAALAEMIPGEHDQTVLRHLRLSPERAAALAAQLEHFAADEDLSNSDEQPYGLLLSLYRANIPVLPPE